MLRLGMRNSSICFVKTLFVNMAESGAQSEFCKNSKKSPRKTWTERETTDLIEMVEGRPCLWNIFEKCYHSRETREKGFQEVSRALNISVADIKAKITSLRAQLGRELAKTRATKSGQGLSDSYKSTWIFWERLQFLTTVLNAGKSKDNLCLENEDEDATEDEMVKETENPGEDVIPQQNASYKKPAKRKRSEAKKEELYATCIKALQEPPPKLESVTKVSSFAMYVDEKLNNLDSRSRALAEKRISDVLFDLDMGNEINSQLPSHPQQFRQFSSGTDCGNVYLQNPLARQADSGQFMSMLKRDAVHYY